MKAYMYMYVTGLYSGYRLCFLWGMKGGQINKWQCPLQDRHTISIGNIIYCSLQEEYKTYNILTFAAYVQEIRQQVRT